MRCGRCGNENAEANRFCGMCGAPLVAKGQAAAQTSAAAAATGLGSAAAERRPALVSPSDAGPKTGPVIAGPSFLGLNTPAAGAGSGRAEVQSDRHLDPVAHRHADTGRDPLQPSSGNLDYLLDDEEEPKRGWGKLILVVAALGLAVGFGYLHWKQGGFDWLEAGDKKPAAATKQTSDAAQSGADSGGATGTVASPDGATPQAGASGAGMAAATGDAAANPAESAAGQATLSQTASEGTPSQSTAPPGTASQSASQNQPNDPNLAEGSASQPAGFGSDRQPPPTEPPAGPKAEARKRAAAKPAAAKPVDTVTEAERYIYGRGVRQDCDRAMRLLKPAAEASNPKAMISLGALYSTGTCTPRDLPTAYRWFALALHKQPDNQALQDDLQKLWGQMTQPERQLAIKLSQ